jgi:hypothetical protein
MTSTPHNPSPAADATIPSSARIYNYWLGGDDHFSVDREVADTFMAAWPTVQASARVTRGFVQRATRFMAEAGVRQFVDIGCGIPITPNVHDIAREIHPDARAVYADNDPIVLAKGQALRDEPGVITIYGDLRDPAAIFTHPEVTSLLDLSQPVGVVTTAVWHFLTEDNIGDYQAQLREFMVPGSYLALSHGCNQYVPQSQIEAGEALFRHTTNPVRVRTREEITALMDGFTIVEPGLVLLGDWRPVDGDPYPEHAPEVIGGVGILL